MSEVKCDMAQNRAGDEQRQAVTLELKVPLQHEQLKKLSRCHQDLIFYLNKKMNVLGEELQALHKEIHEEEKERINFEVDHGLVRGKKVAGGNTEKQLETKEQEHRHWRHIERYIKNYHDEAAVLFEAINNHYNIAHTHRGEK